MSILRPLGKFFQQISKLQQLAPLSTSVIRNAHRPECHRPPTRGAKISRPTLKLRRSAISRKARPPTAVRRLDAPPLGGVTIDGCLDAPPPSADPDAVLCDSIAQAYFAASCTSPLRCLATPLTSRLPSTPTSAPGYRSSVRRYSMEKEFKMLVRRNAKPCFAPKKLKEKPAPIDWTSPCACNFNRYEDKCAGATCLPHVIKCSKPDLLLPYKCPSKPKVVRTKRKKPARKVLLGYKVCPPPPRAKVFACRPRPEPEIPEQPTPRRCPCYAAREFVGPPTCNKVRCAVEPAQCPRRPPPVCVHCPPKK